MNERKLAGANTIVTFFNEIQNLKVYYSQYINFLLELKTKYGNNPLKESIQQEEKGILSQLAQNVRHLCNLAFISYNSIFSLKHLTKNKRISELYYKIVNIYIINTKDLEEFVILLNETLTNEVVNQLLISSQDVVENIYQNESNQQPG